MSHRINMTGVKYGRLTGVAPTDKYRSGQLVWTFKCDCGNDCECDGHSVRKGNTRSCGCLETETKRSPKSHGLCSTKSYWIWKCMMQRCYNKNNSSYKNYGARGIYVDERWHDVERFFADMGEKPDDLTLERVDNDGPYSPDNCKWGTRIEQANNTRQNVRIQYGDEEMTIAQWAKKADIPYSLLSSRLDYGIQFPFCLLPMNLKVEMCGVRA